MYICILTGSDDVLAGFVDYMYSHILPACFVAPLKPGFDLNDGQFYLVSTSAPQDQLNEFKVSGSMIINYYET